MRQFAIRPRNLPTAVAFVCIVFMAWTPMTAAGPGGCIRADLDAEILLPQGALHRAESLQICIDSTYSPVSAIHRVLVDGRPVGWFVSRKTTAEDPTDESAFVQFHRRGEGPMVLEGYTLADGRTYTFRPLPSVTTRTTWVAALPVSVRVRATGP